MIYFGESTHTGRRPHAAITYCGLSRSGAPGWRAPPPADGDPEEDGDVVIRPVTPEALVTRIVERILATEPEAWLRVAVDGAPAAQPARWADAVVDGVRIGGRPVLRVAAEDFLRPASLRLEYGRTNPDAYYEGWLDESGLRRTVLDPLDKDGTGIVVPSLWDAAADRATRVRPTPLPRGGVLILSGSLLLGSGLPFDLAVHLWMSQAALARKTDPDLRWTLPAFQRYDREVGPADFADVVARVDHPDHPAIIDH